MRKTHLPLKRDSEGTGPMPPSEFRGFMEARGWTIASAAAAIGVHHATVSRYRKYGLNMVDAEGLRARFPLVERAVDEDFD